MPWSTNDEIRFINGLGQHLNPGAVVPPEVRLEYLRRYQKAIQLRSNWGSINSESIRQYIAIRVVYYEQITQPTPQHTDEDEKEN